MSDNKYIKGFFVNAPRENAPDFIKGSISMYPDSTVISIVQRMGATSDKIEALKSLLGGLNTDKINLDIKDGKDGWYAQINEWKPNKGGDTVQVQNAPKNEDYSDMGFESSSPSMDDIKLEDIPFS